MERHVKIVLPCTNEGEWLRVTVDSLLKHTHHPDFEICVLANGDTETDFSFLDGPAYRRARLRRVADSLGVGRSINAAVEPGDATYYIFLDAHCLVEQRDWLERAIDALEQFPRASMLQPEVVQFTYPDEIQAGGGIDRSRMQDLSYEYAIRWTWSYHSQLELSLSQTRPLSSEPYEEMSGGGMAVFARAETFHRLGKHDPEVGGWHPKTRDYCIHGWLLGYPMMAHPGIRVYHRRKPRKREQPADFYSIVHGVLRTAFRYLSPRRRDLAETLFRRHGLEAQVERAVEEIHRGRWLEERAACLRERVHDDDWLFSKFNVYEEHYGIHVW